MITVEVDATKGEVRIDRMSSELRAAIRGTIFELTKSLAELVRSKLDGPVLKVRSGRLRDSIKVDARENAVGDYLYGIVFTQGVPYAAIHEYGGTINHPGSSKFQAWQGPGGWVYTNFTRPHPIPMPARSYMRSSLEEMRGEIVSRLTSAARDAVRRS